MIRLHLIEDHPIIYDGLRQRFRHAEEGITVSGYSVSVESFVSGISHDAFDMIILDLWLQGTDPTENLEKIKIAYPDKPVIIYSQDDSLYWINQMIQCGAMAYLCKTASKQEMKDTIQKVYSGHFIFPPFRQEGKPQQDNRGFFRQAYIPKPTEQHILIRLGNGANLKEIASEMHVTVSAVEKTLKKLRKEFSVKTNVELMRTLLERKLI
jgi:DNA-binding NarL/FixJ family response regulator